MDRETVKTSDLDFKKGKRISYLLKKISNERGDSAQECVVKTLYILKNIYRLPIIINPSEKCDRNDREGIDIEIKGRGLLFAHFGIDVKSSDKGVKEYLEQQQKKIEQQRKYSYPRYPFKFEHESQSQLLQRLLSFVLKKSKSHRYLADEVPLGDRALKDFIDRHFTERR